MVLRNNRRSLITLEYKKDGNRTIVPIPAGAEVIILGLIERSDIISKGFFEKGWLTEVLPNIVNTEEPEIKEVEIAEVQKTKKENHQIKNKKGK